MGRAEQLAERLPPLYREGEVVGKLAALWGLQLEVVDEEAREVQRAHVFDRCLELAEAAGLAAILDIPPEPWQTLGEYRPWVHGLRDARLRAGAVTREGIRIFVDRYSAGFQAANRVTITPPVTRFADDASSDAPALIENPIAIRTQRVPERGALAPLGRFEVVNRGLDPTPLELVVTPFGVGAPEYAPLVANLTSGEAVVYLDAMAAGRRLFLRSVEPAGGGPQELRAELEGFDVSEKLRFIRGFAPGPEGPPEPEAGPPRPISLLPGKNELWFMPLAHYDVPGLDRVLLALADLALRQGVWDETRFDESLFTQEAALALQLGWRETTPAAFDVALPAGALRSAEGDLEDAIAARERLELALREALRRLSAAGVRGDVSLRPHKAVQRSRDRLTGVFPARFREVGPTGADRLPDAGGSFGVTDFDDSTFR